MTSSMPQATTEHMIQICRERSSRGVATRADWQRLAEIDPERARRELINYLHINQTHTAPNPYDNQGKAHTGLVGGFLLGVAFMAAYWLFGDWLQRDVITNARQWDVVTFTQYVAASLLPFFAWLGWRRDQKRVAANTPESPAKGNYSESSWDELLTQFDATRKAGGTRMY